MKRKIKKISLSLTVICSMCMLLLVFGYYSIPDSATVSNANPTFFGLYSTSDNAVEASVSGSSYVTDEQYSLFGVVPVKSVSVLHTDRKTLCVGGDVIGLQLFTDGVIVVDVQPFEAENGTASPAQQAGLKKGDIITEVNGIEVSDNYSFSNAVENCGGNEIVLTVTRDDVQQTISVLPQKCKKSGKYRCGTLVRDATLGIGTMTFFDPETGIYGALGHSVSDIDTGELLPIAGGQIVDAYVWNIKKGESGTAGELGGSLEEEVIGSIEKNCQSGVYGILYEEPLCAGEYPVAWATEVKTGPAEIMLSLDGENIESYDIEIDRINADYNAEIKNMVIKITDDELLEKTGGIVQGMSGSPIIQNGMLVGAVTHVLVNDPTKGYAIFIENMLDAAA